MGNLRRANSCRILAVDDNPSVHEAVRTILENEKGFSICGTAGNGAEAVEKFFELRPDIVLMDVNMPRCDGIEASRQIRRLNAPAKILFYSGHPEFAEPALAGGAGGFLTKGTSALALLQAIRTVRQGGIYVDPVPWADLSRRLLKRSPRPAALDEEAERVVRLLVKGYSSKEIGAELAKTARRVEKVRARLMEQFGAKNSAALVLRLAGELPPEKNCDADRSEVRTPDDPARF